VVASDRLHRLAEQVPPSSSIAILAAANEPGPLWSAKLPAMSFSTPIVTDCGSVCACETVVAQPSTQATEMTARSVMTLTVYKEANIVCMLTIGLDLSTS
jgi:hypothetical protein